MSIKPEDILTVTPEELEQLPEKEKTIAFKYLFALERLQFAGQYLRQISAPISEHENLKETILYLHNLADSTRSKVRELIYPVKLKGEKNARKKTNKKSKASDKATIARRKTGSRSTKKARA